MNLFEVETFALSSLIIYLFVLFKTIKLSLSKNLQFSFRKNERKKNTKINKSTRYDQSRKT